MLVMKNPLLCMSSHVHTQTHLTTLSPHPHARTVLGMGFVWGILFFGNHVIMEWLWMMARLVESVEVHSGYDFPYLNPMHLIPGYAGTYNHVRCRNGLFEYNYYYVKLWLISSFSNN